MGSYRKSWNYILEGCRDPLRPYRRDQTSKLQLVFGHFNASQSNASHDNDTGARDKETEGQKHWVGYRFCMQPMQTLARVSLRGGLRSIMCITALPLQISGSRRARSKQLRTCCTYGSNKQFSLNPQGVGAAILPRGHIERGHPNLSR